MLSRADLNKKFYTLNKKGQSKVLKLTESEWTGEPCFTDGDEYYYLDGNKFGYDDDIVAYWPCEYRKNRNILKVILLCLMIFTFGYWYGATVKNLECNYVTEMK